MKQSLVLKVKNAVCLKVFPNFTDPNQGPRIQRQWKLKGTGLYSIPSPLLSGSPLIRCQCHSPSG